ncbi:hypothetical protein [uncultured Caulobacter sp.]|jgi:hypothetical protein|uniref:hypothetical protein n=1 Tax=uncultured Caulobacter sp. TaxID=158749 RepID=UPI00260C268A|nr:hypothetical protein [uncultured Caulobacter sp.]
MWRASAIGVVFGALALAGASGAADAASGSTPSPIPLGASRYLESCGGCHGITGTSAKSEIPVLRDQVGRFVCTDEGRAYLVRLPNVAFAAMDDHTLAQAMNYMVFSLGGSSVPKGARPYSPQEVAALRQRPLKATDLASMRSSVLGRALAACQEQGR